MFLFAGKRNGTKLTLCRRLTAVKDGSVEFSWSTELSFPFGAKENWGEGWQQPVSPECLAGLFPRQKFHFWNPHVIKRLFEWKFKSTLFVFSLRRREVRYPDPLILRLLTQEHMASSGGPSRRYTVIFSRKCLFLDSPEQQGLLNVQLNELAKSAEINLHYTSYPTPLGYTPPR